MNGRYSTPETAPLRPDVLRQLVTSTTSPGMLSASPTQPTTPGGEIPGGKPPAGGDRELQNVGPAEGERGMGDYMPRQDGNLVVWLNQFKTELAASATGLGLAAGDVTAITADIVTLLEAIQDQAGKVAAQQAATAAKKSAKESITPKVRAMAKRIKSLPSYTSEVGERLGIVGVQSTGGEQFPVARPVLTTGTARNGHVAVRFLKNGFSGVQIASRRADGEFVVLKTQLRSPFIDERVNLLKGPETRYYQARYLDGDDLVGEASDILVVTVPE